MLIIIFIFMTKFFLQGYSKQKSKRKPLDYKIVAYQKLYKQIQKQHLFIVNHLIRKLKKHSESGQSSTIAKLQGSLKAFKSIHKSQMRSLTTHLLRQKFKNLSTNIPEQDYQKFQILLSQSQELKELKNKTIQSQSGKSLIQKTTQLQQLITKKKTIKKQKDKLRKTRKLSIKKNPLIVPSSANIHQSAIQQKQQLPKIVYQQKKTHRNNPETAPQRTQFKKVGRNKYLNEKRQKQDKYKERIYQPKSNQNNNNSNNNKLHPSWQAKLESNKNFFIKPFEGKRILL